MIKKLIPYMLLITALPVLAAPPGDTCEKSAKHKKEHTEKMIETFKLREDQVAKFEAVIKEKKEAHKALYKKMAEQRKAINETTMKKLSTILDENQMGRYEAFNEGMRMSLKHKGGKGKMHYKK